MFTDSANSSCSSIQKMAGSTRLELATSGVTGRRSNQLNYDPVNKRRSYTSLESLCGEQTKNRGGLEPPRLVSKRSYLLTVATFELGAFVGIRLAVIGFGFFTLLLAGIFVVIVVNAGACAGLPLQARFVAVFC